MQNAWTTYGERSRPRLAPRHRRKGVIQREGEAGTRLGTALRYLAGRVPGMGEVGGVKDDGEVRGERA
jgi:hypothetical protein